LGGDVKLDIVRRQFAKVEGGWLDLEDMHKRGLTGERSWSSFCAFFGAEDPEALATNMREQVSPPHIDIVASQTAGGVWVLGAYYYLEATLPQLALLANNLEAAK
jgi:hypothetical protein